MSTHWTDTQIRLLQLSAKSNLPGRTCQLVVRVELSSPDHLSIAQLLPTHQRSSDECTAKQSIQTYRAHGANRSLADPPFLSLGPVLPGNACPKNLPTDPPCRKSYGAFIDCSVEFLRGWVCRCSPFGILDSEGEASFSLFLHSCRVGKLLCLATRC